MINVFSLQNEIMFYIYDYIGNNNYLIMSLICKKLNSIYLNKFKNKNTTIKLSQYAVICNNTKLYIMAFINGCPLYKYTYIYALRNKNFDIFKFAYINKLSITKTFCNAIASHGYINFLEFAHENNFEWDEDTTKCLIEKGNIECLKYARKNKCPWNNEYICSYAVEYQQYDCLKYCHENGGILNAYTYYIAKNKNNKLCLEYLIKNKCPTKF